VFHWRRQGTATPRSAEYSKRSRGQTAEARLFSFAVFALMLLADFGFLKSFRFTLPWSGITMIFADVLSRTRLLLFFLEKFVQELS
jgi:hypothetical protein